MLRIVPIELVEANLIISLWHRHHKEVVGHRFSIGCVDGDNVIHGICVVGRPVARIAGDPSSVLEVTRLCTDGTKNACSILYSAAARIGKELGFERIQTYILDSESGHSIMVSGWEFVGIRGGGQWKHTDGKPRRTDQPTSKKGLWKKELGKPRGKLIYPDVAIVKTQEELFV